MTEPSIRPTLAGGAPGIERRGSVRYRYSSVSAQQATAQLADNQWPIQVRDISATGIGLYCQRSFDIGRLLRVDLPSARSTTSRSLEICVVRAVPQRDGTWLIGGAFTQKLSEAELQSLLR